MKKKGMSSMSLLERFWKLADPQSCFSLDIEKEQIWDELGGELYGYAIWRFVCV